jgi:N-methylhydantoinase A
VGFMLGIDVGGTFTDFVAHDPDHGVPVVWKSLSVADDPVSGILRGLEQFPHRDRIETIRLGTTVATNALLERTVAPVAYVTTAGFRDVPFIQRGNRRYHYNLQWVKPKPLVKRRHCFEVSERIDHDGNIVTPLDEAQARALAAEMAAAGEVRAVAVVLLFSYVNPVHEIRIREIFGEVAPHLLVSISYDVLPRWKEYERASTTIADAALRPIVSRQMSDIARRLRENGVNAGVSVIRSNGGEMTLDAAAAALVQLALSGPTGGVVAAKSIAALIGADALVTLDMGGTSTDCATIRGGKDAFTTDFEIEWGVPIQIPMIDIRTIGAGGGSIAWIDKGGMLRVGPESSRSFPGPACYGHGGVEATVTDANVVLGRISPKNFLGGAMRLDPMAARRAIARVGDPLGKNIEQTALAIVDIANSNMLGALRSVLTERGLDPRDFTLMAFGGAGPLHISDLMLSAGIRRGVVPNHPGQQSAYGFTLTDARVDRQRTTRMTSARFDRERAGRVLAQLIAEAVEEAVRQEGSGMIDVACALEMRYFGQNYELELPVDRGCFETADAAQIWAAFHAAHKARFGFEIRGETIEIVNFLATAIGRSPTPEPSRLERVVAEPRCVGRRSVWFTEGVCEVPIFARSILKAGHRIAGPALIEEAASVTVLGRAHEAEIDDFGHILIHQKKADTAAA